MKPRTPSWAIDGLTGDEEQSGKQKKEKERNRERVPNRDTLDHSIASYDAGSYGEPILFTSHPAPLGDIINLFFLFLNLHSAFH